MFQAPSSFSDRSQLEPGANAMALSHCGNVTWIQARHGLFVMWPFGCWARCSCWSYNILVLLLQLLLWHILADINGAVYSGYHMLDFPRNTLRALTGRMFFACWQPCRRPFGQKQYHTFNTDGHMSWKQSFFRWSQVPPANTQAKRCASCSQTNTKAKKKQLGTATGWAKFNKGSHKENNPFFSEAPAQNNWGKPPVFFWTYS